MHRLIFSGQPAATYGAQMSNAAEVNAERLAAPTSCPQGAMQLSV